MGKLNHDWVLKNNGVLRFPEIKKGLGNSIDMQLWTDDGVGLGYFYIDKDKGPCFVFYSGECSKIESIKGYRIQTLIKDLYAEYNLSNLANRVERE